MITYSNLEMNRIEAFWNLLNCLDMETNYMMYEPYEETISPNKEYVENEKDIVNYIVEVYQDKDNVIIVHSKSNSEFFKPIQYKLKFDTNITKDDIDIEWTIGMGNPTPTEDDQLCIAYVSISEKGKVVSKRKISFVNKGIEIIEETLNNK